MQEQQISQIIEDLRAENRGDIKLVCTHISWLLLLPDYVYKIKKPLKYSFLDFSTLERRKFYCQREIELNQRLTDGMYLDVVEIRKRGDRLALDSASGEVIDYAVKMKRMDETRQMDLMLRHREVRREHLDQLANTLSSFHASTDAIKEARDLHDIQEDFADILSVRDFLGKYVGQNAIRQITKAVDFSHGILQTLKRRMTQRHRAGFTIDAHGDLHSGNIFLLREPVIFDCIEFNDHFRHIDILNELAFFCMDLEFYGRGDLATYFFEKYQAQYPCIFNGEDLQIFQYYKLYRTNVKVKVNALKAMQATDSKIFEYRKRLVEAYFMLMRKYIASLPQYPHRSKDTHSSSVRRPSSGARGCFQR